MAVAHIDRELSELGTAPADVLAIVRRILGDQPLTLRHADELLSGLADRLPELPLPLAFEPRLLFDSPAGVAAVSALFESRPPPSMPVAALAPAFVEAVVGSAAESSIAEEDAAVGPGSVVAAGSATLPSAAGSATPPSSVVAEDSLVAAESAAAPVTVSTPAPVIVPPAVARPSLFDPSRAVSDPEATARAIVAAFDDPDTSVGAAAAIAAARARAARAESAPQAEPPVGVRRPERTLSRRPDIEALLEQPLNALDFAREESAPAEDEERNALAFIDDDPTIASPAVAARFKEIAARSAAAAAAANTGGEIADRASEQPQHTASEDASRPTDAPAHAAADAAEGDEGHQGGDGDDFEILVDDEILEIADDDVELVDEDRKD